MCATRWWGPWGEPWAGASSINSFNFKVPSKNRQHDPPVTAILANPRIPRRGACSSVRPPGWRRRPGWAARGRSFRVGGRWGRRLGRRGGESGCGVGLTGGVLHGLDEHKRSDIHCMKRHILLDFGQNPFTKKTHTSVASRRQSGSLLRQAQLGRRF